MRRSKAQKKVLKGVNSARTLKAHTHAFRLGPYLDSWIAEGLTQRQMVDALNDCGAVTPAEYDPDRRTAPDAAANWTLPQLQRVLENVPKARQRVAFGAKRKGIETSAPFHGGAGLFARPERAPLETENQRASSSQAFPAVFSREYMTSHPKPKRDKESYDTWRGALASAMVADPRWQPWLAQAQRNLREAFRKHPPSYEDELTQHLDEEDERTAAEAEGRHFRGSPCSPSVPFPIKPPTEPIDFAAIEAFAAKFAEEECARLDRKRIPKGKEKVSPSDDK